MQTSTTLSQSAIIESNIGLTLNEVRYWCLKEEATAEDLHNPCFYHGGVIKLSFSEEKSVFVTWSEDHDYSATFCLVVHESLNWDPDYYRDFDVTSITPWKDVMGETLKQVHFLGWSEIPFVCALTFETQTVYIGLSDGHTFADSNDIMVKDHTSFWLSPYMEDIRLIEKLD